MAPALAVLMLAVLSAWGGAEAGVILPQPASSSTRCREMHLATRLGVEHEIICYFGIHKYRASVLPDSYFNLYCGTSDIPEDVQAYLGPAGSLSKYFLMEHCPLPTLSYTDTMKRLGVTSVKELKIRLSRDTSLTRKSLEGLEELAVENLNLYDNNLKKIAKDAFAAVPNLIKLELSFNEGLRLPARIFRPLQQLRDLRLCKMGLQELPSLNLSELVALYLGRNALRLTPETFEGATNLESLDLSSNSLTDLPVDVFKPLINLKSLDLSYNNLSTLPSGLFRHNKNLTMLSITQMDGGVPEEFLSDMRKQIFEKSGCNFVESKPGTFVKQCGDEIVM